MNARRRARTLGLTAFLALAAVLGGSLAAPSPAFADQYPSWTDVINARNSVAAQQKLINQINDLLKQLESKVAAAQQDLQDKIDVYNAAETKYEATEARYQAQQAITQNLQAQEDAAAQSAADAKQKAADWAAQVVKVPPTDPTLQFFVQSDDAAKVLSAIGVTSRLSEKSQALYDEAVQQQNVADSLGQQAASAEAELQRLAQQAADELDTATAAAQAAQQASDAAQAALADQQAHKEQMAAQLDVLVKKRAVTEADYQAGVEAAAAAAAAAGGSGGVSSAGWIRPAGGFISAYYGYTSGYGFGFHHGIDFANPCGTAIYAAHSGVVTFAGWNGELGYYMIVNNGGGIWTGYGHQLAGGFKVSVGQTVVTGQRIGTVGMTGLATGCHLHFDVYRNGTRIDPKPFLASVGIYV